MIVHSEMRECIYSEARVEYVSWPIYTLETLNKWENFYFPEKKKGKKNMMKKKKNEGTKEGRQAGMLPSKRWLFYGYVVGRLEDKADKNPRADQIHEGIRHAPQGAD